MGIEIIQPKDEAEWLAMRRDVITSTEVAALFNASPYTTPYELWFRKRDKTIVSIEQNSRMVWGIRLEGAIAKGVAEDQGWSIRKMSEFVRDTDLRLGASFDYSVNEDTEILEVKNVDSLAFRDGWLVDGDNVEAPLHIEIQVQVQLLVSGRKTAWIAALIGGNKVVLIGRERDEKVIEAIKKKVKEFWGSIERNEEPKPDFARDSKFIASLHAFAQPGTVYEGDAESVLRNLVEEYKRFGEIEKNAKAGKDEMKAKILMEIGTAEKVKGETFSISAGMIGPKEYTVKSDGYRDFRCTLKKEKAVL
jgi:putative phage-type endonuclease